MSVCVNAKAMMTADHHAIYLADQHTVLHFLDDHYSPDTPSFSKLGRFFDAQQS